MVSRRSLLKNIVASGILPGYVSGSLAAEVPIPVWKLATSFASRTEDLLLKFRLAGEIAPWRAKLLFPNSNGVAAHVEPFHHLLQGAPRPHPDNLLPATQFLSGLGIRFEQAERIDPGSADLLAMGEPTSDRLAQWIFPSAANPNQNPLGLPVTYAYTNDERVVSRFVEGREYRSPLRGINHPQRFRNGPRLVDADLRNSQFQCDDYLVITALPNFFDSDVLSNGNRIVIAGGVHGIGTRAFPMLFSEQHIWQKLEPLLEEHQDSYFQAVFHIEDVVHEDSVSRPGSIEFSPEVDFYSLKDRDEDLRAIVKHLYHSVWDGNSADDV